MRVASYLPYSDREDLPTGHAVLHFMILGPLPGQRLRLLDLNTASAVTVKALNFNQAQEQQNILKYTVDFKHFSFLPLIQCLMTDLKRLVLSSKLLHGRCCVVQLPPQLHHLGLQFFYLTFTLHTPGVDKHKKENDLWQHIHWLVAVKKELEKSKMNETIKVALKLKVKYTEIGFLFGCHDPVNILTQ